LRVGSKCWTMTKAMPLFFGTCDRKCSNASNPPAEAPMPTTGNETLVGETGIALRAARAGFFCRRSCLDLVFIVLLATPAEVAGIRRHTASECRDWPISLRLLVDIKVMRKPIDGLDGFFHQPLGGSNLLFEALRRIDRGPLFQRQQPDIDSQQSLGDFVV